LRKRLNGRSKELSSSKDVGRFLKILQHDEKSHSHVGQAWNNWRFLSKPEFDEDFDEKIGTIPNGALVGENIKWRATLKVPVWVGPYEREQRNANQSSEPVNTNKIMPKLPEAEKKLTKTFNSNVCIICKKSGHNTDGCSEFIAAVQIRDLVLIRDFHEERGYWPLGQNDGLVMEYSEELLQNWAARFR
jgi:hypothetical protein